MTIRFKQPVFSKSVLLVGGSLLLATAVSARLLWHEISRQPVALSAAGLTVTGEIAKAQFVPPTVFLRSPGDAVPVISNLFHSVSVERTLIKLDQQKALLALREASRASAQSPSPKEDKDKPLPPAVRFCFQGVVETEGGLPVALISTVPKGRTASFGEGEPCCGATVTHVARDSVDLILKDNSTRTLARGIPLTIAKEALHEY